MESDLTDEFGAEGSRIDFNRLAGSTGLGNINYILLILGKMLPEYIFDVSKYEGNTATLPDVMTIVDGITVDGLTLKESHMIEDLSLGWDYVIECIEEQRQCTIKQLHARLSYKIIGESGVFRTANIKMLGADDYVCPIPCKLEDIYKSIMPSGINAETLLEFYCKLVYNQLFEDCNKRTARIFVNYYFITIGIGIFNISQRDSRAYNNLLIPMMNTGNFQPMIEWLLRNAVWFFEGREIIYCPKDKRK